MMETSRLDQACQRPREQCEPGQGYQLKILPEPQTETALDESICWSKCAGLITR
jgi:hypothetical protein